MARPKAADAEAPEATEPKAAKIPLTKEERLARVQGARQEKVRAAFEGKQFEYVGPVHLEKGQEYTDPTGNKGQNGHELRDTATGETIIVGPGSLKKAIEQFGAVTGYPPPKPVQTEEAPAEA